jgi:C1A family cysteine protease
VTVTSEIDIAEKVGPVRNQGKRPTCVAFATSDLHAAARTVAYSPLSVEYLYFHACRRSPQFDPTKGVTLKSALAAVEHDGQPEEAAWPYLATLPSALASYTVPPGITTVFKRAGELLPTNYDSVKSELVNGRPVMLVFRSSVALLYAKADEPLLPSPLDIDTVPHAVIAVGTGNSGTRRCLKVKNSWGEGWGAAGYAWVSEDYFAARLIAVVRMV